MKKEFASPKTAHSRRNILIVEDDYVKYLLVQDILLSLPVCLVRAVSFSEAIDMLQRKSNFDLLILNAGISGTRNCMEINRMKLFWPHIPVLVIASRMCKERERDCFPLCCDTIIYPASDSRGLMDTVNEMLYILQ